MNPWGSEVEDDRFGLLLSAMQKLAGGDWQDPKIWFKRSKSQAEQKQEKDRMLMAERARLNFRALSAAQAARKSARSESS